MTKPDARRKGMRLTAVALALTLLGGFAVADGFAAPSAEAAVTDPVAPPTDFYPTTSGGAPAPSLFATNPCPLIEVRNKALFNELGCTVTVLGTTTVPSSLVPEIKISNIVGNCSNKNDVSMDTGTSAVRYVEQATTNSFSVTNTTTLGFAYTKSWGFSAFGATAGGSLTFSVQNSTAIEKGSAISNAVQDGQWSNESQSIKLPPYSWGYFAFQSQMDQVDLLWQWTPNPDRPKEVSSDLQTINVRAAKGDSTATGAGSRPFGRVVDRIVPMNPAEIEACWKSALGENWKAGDPVLGYGPGSGELASRIVQEPAMLRPAGTVDMVSYPSIYSTTREGNPITRNIDRVAREPFVGPASTARFDPSSAKVQMWKRGFWGLEAAESKSSLVMPPGSELGFWTGNACNRLTAEIGGSAPTNRKFEQRVEILAVKMVKGQAQVVSQLGDFAVASKGNAAGENAPGKIDVAIPPRTEAIAIRAYRPDKQIQDVKNLWIFDGTRDTVIVSNPKLECDPADSASRQRIRSAYQGEIRTGYANLAATPAQVQADPYRNLRPNATPFIAFPQCSTTRPDYIGYSCNGTATKSNGTTYVNAIGVHSPTEISWGLTTPSCSAFQFEIAFDDHMAGNKDRRPVTIQVYVDGVLQQTARMTPYPDSNPLFAIDQAITQGPHMLKVALVPDNNIDSASHINIINPRLKCQFQSLTEVKAAAPTVGPTMDYVPVGSLTWSNEVAWHGPALRNGLVAAGRIPLAIAGISFPEGIGAHAFSSFDVKIPRKDCSVFMADVGVLDSGLDGSVQFEIWGNGKRIAQSRIMRSGEVPALMQADISGLTTITLKVRDGGDNVYWDHAGWGRPVIGCAPKAAAQPVTPPTSTDPTPPPTPQVQVSAARVPWAENSYEYRPSTRGQNLDTGQPVSIHGQKFDTAIAQVSRGVVRLSTLGECSQFTATIGVDDYARAYNAGTLKFEIFGDGVPITASPVMYSSSPADTLTAYISGVQSLELRVTDAGDGIDWDHAVWGNPTLTCQADADLVTSAVAPSARFISEMPWRKAEWSDFEIRRDMNMMNTGPVRIAGTEYERGVGAHSWGVIRVPVSVTCTTFIADIGIDDTAGNNGSVTFQVWGNSTMLYESPKITGSMDKVHIEIPLNAAGELALTVTDAGDGPNWDHGSWGNPQVTCLD